MSAPNPFITPTTAAVTRQLPDAQHGDKVILYITGSWGIGEDATVNVPTSTGGLNLVINSLGAAVTIGNTITYIELEGGFLYTIVKNNTLNPAGIDFQVKPRIGPH
jgi:hypothetical protein